MPLRGSRIGDAIQKWQWAATYRMAVRKIGRQHEAVLDKKMNLDKAVLDT